MFRGHTAKITALVLASAEGGVGPHWAVTGGVDGSIKIWTRGESECVGTLDGGHDGPIRGLAVSANKRVLASVGDDGLVCVWDVATLKCYARMANGNQALTGVALSASGDRVATSSMDGVARIYDIDPSHIVGAQPKVVASIGDDNEGDPNPLYCVALSANGNMMAAGGINGRVELLNNLEQKARSTRVVCSHPGPVRSLTFSGNQTVPRHARKVHKTWLVTGCDDCAVRVWEVPEAAGHELHKNWLKVQRKYLSSQGHKQSSTAVVGKVIKVCRGHSGPVTGLSFNAATETAASVDTVGLVRVWDFTHPDPNEDIPSSAPGPVVSVSSSDSGHRIAMAGGGICTLLDIEETRGIINTTVIGKSGSPVLSVSVCPSGAFVACGREDGSVLLYCVGNGRSAECKGHTGPVRAVSLSVDCAVLASGSKDSTMRLWAPRDWCRAQSANGLGGGGGGDGLETKEGGGVVEQLECTKTFRSHKGGVHAVAVSRDCTLVATGGADMKANVYRVSNGKVVASVGTKGGEAKEGKGEEKKKDGDAVGHTGAVTAVALSYDNTTLATGSADKTSIIWDMKDGGIEKYKFDKHTDVVTGVVLSPDASFLATCSADRSLRVWHLETQSCAAIMRGHEEAVTSMAMAGNHQLVTGSEDGEARRWDLVTNEIHDILSRPSEKDGSELGAILKGSGSVHGSDSIGRTLLQVAAEYRNKKAFVSLISLGQSDYDADHQRDDGRSLTASLCAGDLVIDELDMDEVAMDKMTASLLKLVIGRRSANPNMADDALLTPLMRAICHPHEHPCVVRELVRANVDMSALDPDGYTAMQYAVMRGHIGNLRALTSHKDCAKNIDLRCSGVVRKSDAGRTALSFAVDQPVDQAEFVRELLASKADLLIQDTHHKRAPLHFACARCHVQSAKELINGFAVVDAADKYGHTPLFIAVTRASLQLVVLLLQSGARTTLPDEDSWVPLSFAMMDPACVYFAKLIVQHKAAYPKTFTEVKDVGFDGMCMRLTDAFEVETAGKDKPADECNHAETCKSKAACTELQHEIDILSGDHGKERRTKIADALLGHAGGATLEEAIARDKSVFERFLHERYTDAESELKWALFHPHQDYSNDKYEDPVLQLAIEDKWKKEVYPRKLVELFWWVALLATFSIYAMLSSGHYNQMSGLTSQFWHDAIVGCRFDFDDALVRA